ncbi:MAG: polyhydroxybutyrate depolymerase [Candidatus Omnitrophica bacterium]|nr:polyhydroxybutyrate depolymerase [Candidatus Omnitrophota bacterium]
MDDIKGSIIWDNRERTYRLHVPLHYLPDQIYPLVIVLHGGAANAEYAMRMSEMNRIADEENFLVLYPNGTGIYKHAVLTWNAGNCCGYAHEHQVDDVGFIRSLIGYLQSHYGIDSKRIYATGISNGAMMAYRLAVEMAGVIAAIAPVAGPFNHAGTMPEEPVSVIAFHGLEDQHAPYLGGTGPKTLYPRIDRPVQESIRLWVEHNQCSREPQIEKKGKITCETYHGGRGESRVVLYTLEEEGHTWPGGQPGLRNGNVDPPTQEISASRLIWDFFKAHPKS